MWIKFISQQAEVKNKKGQHPWTGVVAATNARLHLAVRKDRQPLLNLYEGGHHLLCQRIDACAAISPNQTLTRKFWVWLMYNVFELLEECWKMLCCSASCKRPCKPMQPRWAPPPAKPKEIANHQGVHLLRASQHKAC